MAFFILPALFFVVFAILSTPLIIIASPFSLTSPTTVLSTEVIKFTQLTGLILMIAFDFVLTIYISYKIPLRYHYIFSVFTPDNHGRLCEFIFSVFNPSSYDSDGKLCEFGSVTQVAPYLYRIKEV